MFALKLFSYFPYIWQVWCSIWWCSYSVLKPNSNHCIERLKWIVLDLPLCWIDFFLLLYSVCFWMNWNTHTHACLQTHIHPVTLTHTRSVPTGNIQQYQGDWSFFFFFQNMLDPSLIVRETWSRHLGPNAVLLPLKPRSAQADSARVGS